MTSPHPDFDAKARELLSTLTDINSHMGYQFTQPLMVSTARIASALRSAHQAGWAARGEADAEIARAYQRGFIGENIAARIRAIGTAKGD